LITWRVALTPGGCQIGYMEGCTHSRGGCQIGYMDNIGCHQLMF
jgi:hypothetical protein